MQSWSFLGCWFDLAKTQASNEISEGYKSDNVHAMLRFKSPDGDHGRPAKGMLWASQIAAGHENGLKLRVYGDKGSIEWVQAALNYLW